MGFRVLGCFLADRYRHGSQTGFNKGLRDFGPYHGFNREGLRASGAGGGGRGGGGGSPTTSSR